MTLNTSTPARRRMGTCIIAALLAGLAGVSMALLMIVLRESPLEKEVREYLDAADSRESDPNIISLAELGQPAVSPLARAASWKPGFREKLSGWVWRYDVLRADRLKGGHRRAAAI